jgi:hypothetical protein
MKTILIKLLIVVLGFSFPQEDIKKRFTELGLKNPRVEFYFLDGSIFSFLSGMYLTGLVDMISSNRNVVYHLVQDLWIDANGTQVLGGIAYVCSVTKKKRGHMSIAPWTENPARIEHAKIAFLHEIAHQLGARHDDTHCNIMHPDAMGCFDKEFCQTPETCKATNLLWSRKSQQEVKRCLNVALWKKQKSLR